MTLAEGLTPSELAHLALHAARQGEHEKAIAALRRVLVSTPDDAESLYLLGALHADIGMYAEAKDEMNKALHLNPDMSTARFQLGLLHFTSGDALTAESVWQQLETLDDKHPLKLFKEGLLALSRDEFDACRDNLERGISANVENESLNNDMRLVISEIDKLQANGKHENTDDIATGGQRHFLSAYEQQPDGE